MRQVHSLMPIVSTAFHLLARVLPNPSLHPTRYSGLRPLPRAGELKRYAPSMKLRALLLLIVAACSTSAAAEPTVPSVTAKEKEVALAAIKKWKGFEGTWEGELRYVAAPTQDWYKQRQPVRIVLRQAEIKILTRVEGDEWTEIAQKYSGYQPDELSLVIHAYGSGGVWTENNVFVLTRRSENEAEVFVQRVVNNWIGKPLPGEDLIYGDSRAGNVKRKTGA